MFNSIKAAKAAEFRERKDYEYGGEEITVKGKRLVKNPKEAISKTEWRKRGRAVKTGETPHAERYINSHGHAQYYNVFREDQTRKLRRTQDTEPILVDELAALFTLNRSAKRWRNTAKKQYESESHGLAGNAKRQKVRRYDLKGQALHYLIAEGRLSFVGHHKFQDGNYAEILKGEGYCFHRPCASPNNPEAATVIDEIEAKPRGATEPRIKDAVFTIETFLNGKPTADVYRWLRP